MIIMQNFQIAGKSRQAFDTALPWKHGQSHHGEIRGYGKKSKDRDNPQPSPKFTIYSKNRMEKVYTRPTY